MAVPVRRTAATLLAAALLLSGCGVVDDSPDRKEETTAMTNAIEADVAGEPGVITVSVHYTNMIDLGEHVTAAVTARPGTDPAHLLDLLAEDVWLSELTPLGSITLSVDTDPSAGGPSTLGTTVGADYVDDDQYDRSDAGRGHLPFSDLAARYGKRPV